MMTYFIVNRTKIKRLNDQMGHIVEMRCQLLLVSHEDHQALPLGADRADQLLLEGIKWPSCLGPLQGPLVQKDARVQD